jgi:hypothetical protein
MYFTSAINDLLIGLSEQFLSVLFSPALERMFAQSETHLYLLTCAHIFAHESSCKMLKELAER